MAENTAENAENKDKKISFRNFEIVQQVAYLKDKSIESIKKVLENDIRVEKYAYILHDKDVDEDGKPKSPHYHIMVRLDTPRQLSTISKMFHNEIPEQYIQKIKSRWANALAYLTHANAPRKYQYSPEGVTSNFDWQGEAQSAEIDTILEKIASGEIRRFNYTQFINSKTYIKHKRDIETAFSYRTDELRNKGVDRNMDCIFITGGSGTGKTTFAKEYARKQGMSVFVSSGSNDPLDGYEGQDCLILDDLRPSCLSLSDLLKLLDNNTASTVKSRYKNKFLECRLVIITTVLNIDDFFSQVFTEQPETAKQLRRRCKTMVNFPDNPTDIVTIKVYNDDTDRYEEVGKMDNPLSKLIKKKEINKKIILENFKIAGAEVWPTETEEEDILPF